MKFLVLFACVAAASAQLVTHLNGAVTPALTPDVAAATAAHFAAKGVYAGYPYAGAYGYPYAAGAYGAWAGAYPYAGAYAGWAGAYGAYPYYAPLVAHPNGAVVPAEPADVVAARAEHLAALAAPLEAPVAPVVAPLETVANVYAAGYPGLVAHANGALVPAEPEDVVAARAEHLAAHA
jgi:hypothetical protein